MFCFLVFLASDRARSSFLRVSCGQGMAPSFPGSPLCLSWSALLLFHFESIPKFSELKYQPVHSISQEELTFTMHCVQAG